MATPAVGAAAPIILRDSTLREGLDTPDVVLTPEHRLRIAALLAEAGVDEIEVVAPSRVADDLEIARAIKAQALPLRVSGLIYANGRRCPEEIDLASPCLDWVTLLMPLSPKRAPAGREEKIALLTAGVDRAVALRPDVGAGFPHSTQTDVEDLLRIGSAAVARGARRITIYDTNGTADPFRIGDLIARLCGAWGVDVFFHAHNDLGLATANALAAVAGGARGLDVTVNGLGDRAGNASLEQVVMGLRLRGVASAVHSERLTELSRAVEALSGVAVSGLAPVVGAYVFMHKSPSHLQTPELFEAFDPALVGERRRLVR